MTSEFLAINNLTGMVPKTYGNCTNLNVLHWINLKGMCQHAYEEEPT